MPEQYKVTKKARIYGSLWCSVIVFGMENNVDISHFKMLLEQLGEILFSRGGENDD